jgi:hypothetical protein
VVLMRERPQLRLSPREREGSGNGRGDASRTVLGRNHADISVPSRIAISRYDMALVLTSAKERAVIAIEGDPHGRETEPLGY